MSSVHRRFLALKALAPLSPDLQKTIFYKIFPDEVAIHSFFENHSPSIKGIVLDTKQADEKLVNFVVSCNRSFTVEFELEEEENKVWLPR